MPCSIELLENRKSPKRRAYYAAAYFDVECSDAGDLIPVTDIAENAIFRGSIDDYQWEIEVAEGRILG